MTRLRVVLASLVIALVSCAGTATVVVRDVSSSPPPNHVERADYRPGYVFIQGHWTRRGPGRWVWSSGYYERERPGYVYIEGRWLDDERGGYTWVDGEWRRRGGIVSRERR